MPLLGFGYLITIVGPHREYNKTAYTVFQIGRSLLLSTQVSYASMKRDTTVFCQGLMISIAYCFLNDEVQTVLRTHWRRARMVRMVGRERRPRTESMRTSLRVSYCEHTQNTFTYE